MKTVIIGCGNIGIKRINAIANIPEIEIAGLVEVNSDQAKYLTENFSFPVGASYQQYLTDDSIESFIVSATTKPALAIVRDALNAGKHVLCEKPLGSTFKESEEITNLANTAERVLQVGFNIRYDQGIQKAKFLIKEGKIGETYFFKCTYVNGSVKTNNNHVGALMDMGIHNVYLAHYFMGDIYPEHSSLQRFEYDITDRDDNGFVTLQSKNMIGTIHFSLVRWRNDFQLEITGSDGSIVVDSLTKWGKQTVTLFERVYPSGFPIETMFTFENDKTWEVECREFYRRVTENDLLLTNENLIIMNVIEEIKNKSAFYTENKL